MSTQLATAPKASAEAKWLTPGMHPGVPNDLYHQDRTAVSSTWLKILDASTPFHLRCHLDAEEEEPSDALIMGAAVDTLIFEPKRWDDHFIIAPELNLRTNDGRATMAALWEQAKEEHKYVIRNERHAEALVTAAAIRRNPVMADILRRETVIFQPTFVWIDPVTGLKCKCKLDVYDITTGEIFDLKTAECAAEPAFSRAIANYGYHIQDAFYSDGVRCAGQRSKSFTFCVQEKPSKKMHTTEAHPNLMAFYKLPPEEQDAGRDAYSSALAAINFCMLHDEWPGYTNQVVDIRRPGWATRNDMESLTSL